MPKLLSVLLRPILKWIDELYIIDFLLPSLSSQTVYLLIHFTGPILYLFVVPQHMARL